MDKASETIREFDVVICGGGLAGLCLARQLTLHHPEWSVLVLDRLSRPLPEADFKVGESSIEVGAYYLAEVLKLRDHLENDQLEKYGLRYFYGGGGTKLEERGEFGLAGYLPAKSYQISRGRLENYLRDLVVEGGVLLEEGCSVEGITIATDGSPHEICYGKVGEDASCKAKARWVIDAMGRRRFLQKKFDLEKNDRRPLNAAWFRVEGRIEVDHMVAGGETPWHRRVQHSRWYSTNHLMGAGYWVWLIPLADEKTSVGIVAAEDHHPFTEYSSFDKAIAWLEKHEPDVANHLTDCQLLDFKKFRGYSYSSKQVFSADRWACVGEAGLFIDPYYSVGTNMIAFSNGLVERMMELDSTGDLNQEFVDYANRYYLSLNDTLAQSIHSAYTYLNNNRVMVFKTIWDYFIGWGVSDPQFYEGVYLDPKISGVLSTLISSVVVTQARMLNLFEEWARSSNGHGAIDYVDYFEDLPTLRDLFLKNLPPRLNDLTLIVKRIREGGNRIEELAQVIFLLAVEDVLPDKAHLFRERPWLNTAAISLNSESWEEDGLFRPKSKPRPLASLEAEMRRLLRTPAMV